MQRGRASLLSGQHAFRQAGVTFVGFPPYKRNDRGGLSFSSGHDWGCFRLSLMLVFLSAKRRGKDIDQHETKQETWSHPNRSHYYHTHSADTVIKVLALGLLPNLHQFIRRFIK